MAGMQSGLASPSGTDVKSISRLFRGQSEHGNPLIHLKVLTWERIGDEELPEEIECPCSLANVNPRRRISAAQTIWDKHGVRVNKSVTSQLGKHLRETNCRKACTGFEYVDVQLVDKDNTLLGDLFTIKLGSKGRKRRSPNKAKAKHSILKRVHYAFTKAIKEDHFSGARMTELLKQRDDHVQKGETVPREIEAEILRREGQGIRHHRMRRGLQRQRQIVLESLPELDREWSDESEAISDCGDDDE